MGKKTFKEIQGILYCHIIKILVFSRNVLIHFYKDRCLIRASGMAYSSLLALVPLSALVFSLLTAFGAFDKLKETIQVIIFQQLLPTRQNDIIQYINIFIENTKALGVVGLLLFTITSVFLISNIQGNFNDIWKVRKKRNFFSQFAVYISVIILSTLLIGSGFAITGWIKSRAADISFIRINQAIQFLITFSPKVLFSFTLFIIILAVPSVRVKITGAFAGAVFGGLLMWGVKKLFATWSATAISYSLIYGSIALIPIFLIWLYIIWLVILLSVEISCVWQNNGADIEPYDDYVMFSRFRSAFETYLMISERYMENSGGITADDLSDAGETDGIDIQLLNILEQSGLVYRVENGIVFYVPSSPPHTTETESVIRKITGYSETGESRYSIFYNELAEAVHSDFYEKKYKYISGLLYMNAAGTEKEEE